MQKNLFEILPFLTFLLFASCKVQRTESFFSIDEVEKILLVYDSSDIYSLKCVENAKWAFKYAKLNYDEIDLVDYPEVKFEKLQNYYALVFATEFIKKLSRDDCERIKDFVFSGGGLAIIYRGYN
ncbi:Uncharacterized protein conserved in bacteria (DUF2194) [Candidatus Kryptobacter tengchongensis]|nr:Uncharacterized protein conserved in bacteria (DUF2194) [Candidatus Kryptobacter tengchongensis]